MLNRLTVLSLGNKLRRIKKEEHVIITIFNRNQVVEIDGSTFYHLFYLLLSSIMIRKEVNQVVRLKVVFKH